MSSFISREVVTRIQRDHVELLGIVSEMRHAARHHDAVRMRDLTETLAKAVSAHVGLVDGVLDALQADDVDFERYDSSLSSRPR